MSQLRIRLVIGAIAIAFALTLDLRAACSSYGIYNIVDYGAVRGGNVATAFNAAKAAAASCGGVGTIWIPDGIFYMDAALDATHNVDGVGTLKNPGSSSTTQTLSVSTAEGVSIKNITIDGGATANGGSVGSHGLLIYKSNVTVDGVKIQNTRGSGVYVETPSGTPAVRNIAIRNSRITNTYNGSGAGPFGDGITLMGVTDALVTGNHIEKYNRIGVTAEQVYDIYSDRISVTNNMIRNGGTSTSGEYIAGIWCENTNQALIANNFISDNRNDSPNESLSRGIQVYPTADPAAGTSPIQYSFTIADNVIEGCYVGIGIGGTVANASYQVSGGTIRDFDFNGINVYQIGGIVSVTGVHFGPRLAGSLAGPGAGLVVVDQYQAGTQRVLKNVSVTSSSKDSAITYAHVDAADFQIYSAGATRLLNVKLASLIGTWRVAMKDWVDTVEVYDSKLAVPTGSFLAASQYDGEQWASSAPSGVCTVGDLRFNTQPTAGGTIGWVCVNAVGTWKTFGGIAP
jgi:hypothetical protein